MKRRPSYSNTPSGDTSDILYQLINQGKVTGNKATYAGIENYPEGRRYPANIDMAKFLSKSLADEPNFTGINFPNAPLRDARGNLSDFYDPQTRKIDMFGGRSAPSDPLNTFVHEGTHALDHVDRSDLNITIPWLAKREQEIRQNQLDKLPNLQNQEAELSRDLFKQSSRLRDGIDAPSLKAYREGDIERDKLERSIENYKNNPTYLNDTVDMIEYPQWYKQSQAILGNDDFTGDYPYEGAPREMLNQNLSQVGANGRPIGNALTSKKTGVANFRGLSEILKGTTNPQDTYFKNTNTAGQYEGIPYMMIPPSEVKSFAIENLHEPYKIDSNNWQQVNTGRRFLKNMMKGTYDDFQRRDPRFPTNYPAANTAFMDRISQLRDYNKYPEPQNYLTHYNNKKSRPAYDNMISEISQLRNPANNPQTTAQVPQVNTTPAAGSNSSAQPQGARPYAYTPSQGNQTTPYGQVQQPPYGAPQNQNRDDAPARLNEFDKVLWDQSQGYR